MDTCLISQSDTRPEAFDLMAGAVTDAERNALRDWLEGVFLDARQVVVKDPRAAWVPWLWTETGDELAVTTGFLTMLRHPAEVVASRATYYGTGAHDRPAVRYRLRSLATWININVGLERRTRGRPRVVARYEDLVADWRRTMGRVREAFALDIDVDGDGDGPRQVDAFVDPALRRHAPSWDGMGLPSGLVEIAEGVWQAMGEIADGADGPKVAERLDALGDAYAEEVDNARAMMHDALAAEAARARRGDPSRASPGSVRTARTGDKAAGAGHRFARRWVPRRVRRFVVHFAR
jgi:hypothetical protein